MIDPPPRQIGRRRVAHIAQLSNRRVHLAHRHLAHPGARVQNPVHGRKADLSDTGNVVDRGIGKGVVGGCFTFVLCVSSHGFGQPFEQTRDSFGARIVVTQ